MRAPPGTARAGPSAPGAHYAAPLTLPQRFPKPPPSLTSLGGGPYLSPGCGSETARQTRT